MSEGANLLQYQAYAQPVPLNPAAQVNPVWFPQWTQPISEPVLSVEYRHLLPSFFFVGEPNDFTVPETTVYAWIRDTEQPVVNPEYRHTIPDFFFTEQSIITPVTVPDYGYFRPAEQPVLPEEYRHLLQSVFFPPREEIISTSSGVFFEAWTQPTQQPVLPVEYRFTIPYLFVQVEPGDFRTGASAPTAFPLKLDISVAITFNYAEPRKSANNPLDADSQNDLDL